MPGVCLLLAWQTARNDQARASEMDGREEKDNARGEGRARKDTGMKGIRGKVRRFDDEGGISVTSVQLL